MFAVIDGSEMIDAQQLRQSASVNLVILIVLSHGSVLPWIANNQFRDVRLQEVVQPSSRGSFFKRDIQKGRPFILRPLTVQVRPSTNSPAPVQPDATDSR